MNDGFLITIMLALAPMGISAPWTADVRVATALPVESAPGAFLVATPDSGGTPPTDGTFKVPLTGATVSFALPGDTPYRLALDGEIWMPPVLLPEIPKTERLALVACRTGALEAKLRNATGVPLDDWPSEVEARFQVLRGPLDLDSLQTYTMPCPVAVELRDREEIARLRCRLPEGTLNVRLAAEGYVPTYLSSLALTPGETLEVPTFELQEGASLVGVVVTPDGVPAEDGQVSLLPAVADLVARTQTSLDTVTQDNRATTNEEGFFQLRGLPLGSFDLAVEVAGQGTVRVPEIVISESAEHDLAEPVVVPHFPHATVSVSPARAPGGGPWTVALFNRHQAERMATTDESGEARFDLLPPGRYHLMLEATDGRRHVLDEIDLSPDQPRAEVELGRVPVFGTLTHAGEPLQADLYFGGRRGAESIHTSSNEDGELATLLPREGEWILEIESEEPPIRVSRRDLLVALDPQLGAAELTIELPATRIEGRVLDADRRPVPKAQVVVQAGFEGGGVTQVQVEEDGRFDLAGQAPGSYQLTALGPAGTMSTVVTVELEEDRPLPPVELLVRPMRTIEGRVVNGDGRGVPGAIVWPVADLSGDAAPVHLLTRQVRSGSGGEFRLRLGSEDPRNGLVVLAPGFPLAVQAVPSGLATISLSVVLSGPSEAGELLLPPPPESSVTTLLMDGRWELPFFLLAQRAGWFPDAGSAEPLRLTGLPPGLYRACHRRLDSAESCAEGFLSSGGKLSLNP